jgi:imidazole glycerol-phosphate synthase subunit HisF
MGPIERNMVYKRLIPSLLLANGRLVKGSQFSTYKDAGDPVGTTRAHNHQGADEIILSDVEAAQKKSGPDTAIIRSISQHCSVPLTVFGGISSVEIAARCFDCGIEKIGLTTAAIDDPDLLDRLARRYGSQAVTLGIDVVTTYQGIRRVYDHRSKSIIPKLDPIKWGKQCVEKGIGEIRLMSVDREGTGSGYDLDLVAEFLSSFNIPIVVEGGAGTLVDIEKVFRLGPSGVALGSMLVFSDNNLVKIKEYLLNRKIKVRRG